MARKSKQLSTIQNINPITGDRPNFIDLFCGCGGFSLGLERAGFECAAWHHHANEYPF